MWRGAALQTNANALSKRSPRRLDSRLCAARSVKGGSQARRFGAGLESDRLSSGPASLVNLSRLDPPISISPSYSTQAWAMTIESAPRLTPKLTSTGMPRRARSMCRASAWERQCFPPGTTLPTCEIAQAMLSVFADVLNSLGERTQPRSSKGRTEGYGNTQRAIRIAESNRAALTTSHSLSLIHI